MKASHQHLPADCMLKMYHFIFRGAFITVDADSLFVQTDGLTSLKFLFTSVVNVRPMCHAAVSFTILSALLI